MKILHKISNIQWWVGTVFVFEFTLAISYLQVLKSVISINYMQNMHYTGMFLQFLYIAYSPTLFWQNVKTIMYNRTRANIYFQKNKN